MLSDLCDGLRLQLPTLSELTVNQLSGILSPYSPIANPLDAWGNGDLGKTFEDCIAAIGRDPCIDAVVVCIDVQSRMGEKQAEYYAIAARSITKANQQIEKPVVVFSNLSGGIHPFIGEILEPAGIPVLQGTFESLNAIRHWMGHLVLDTPAGQAKSPAMRSRSEVSLPAVPAGGIFAEHASKAVLKAFGIPVTASALATTIDEAKAAAVACGYPVVLKVDSSDIPHKSKVGAVALKVPDESTLALTYRKIIANVNAALPNARINGVSVQEMLDLSNATELIAGLSNDHQCGPVVLLGIGGIHAEVLNDTAIRLAPLNAQDAHAMLEEIRGAPLLANLDRKAIVDVLLNLSDLAIAMEGRIAQVDINPLVVFPLGQGAVAADALITAHPEL